MNEATIFWVKAESNLNLTQATKLMVALREVSSVNVQIFDAGVYGTNYTLFIKKSSVNEDALLMITEVSGNFGSRVTVSDVHYMIIWYSKPCSIGIKC